MQNLDINKLSSLLETARHIAILLPQNPSYDAVASALSLKLSLVHSGKDAVVACSDSMTVEFHRLVGVDTIVNTFGSRNLVITFPGQTENVDKVSYNIENGMLQLVVTPKADAPGLDHTKLQFVSGVAQADAVILVGIKDMNELGQLYIDAKEVLDKTSQYFLNENVLSDSMAHILRSLNLPITPDVASNLLSGIERATNSFQNPNTTADTFELAAMLLRQGARRQSDLAQASEYPAGSIPTPTPQDWTEPKIYRGTTVS